MISDHTLGIHGCGPDFFLGRIFKDLEDDVQRDELGIRYQVLDGTGLQKHQVIHVLDLRGNFLSFLFEYIDDNSLNILDNSKVILFLHPLIDLPDTLTQVVTFIGSDAAFDCSLQVGILLQRHRLLQGISWEKLMSLQIDVIVFLRLIQSSEIEMIFEERARVRVVVELVYLLIEKGILLDRHEAVMSSIHIVSVGYLSCDSAVHFQINYSNYLLT